MRCFAVTCNVHFRCWLRLIGTAGEQVCTFASHLNRNLRWSLYHWHHFLNLLLFFSGTAYGKGCYFAVDSSYSVGYAKRGRGTKYGFIFLSLVLTGDYTQGSPDMRSPPEKYSNGEEKLLYDSVVDNMNNPQMFVVFKDSSVYPSYLVVFS